MDAEVRSRNHRQIVRVGRMKQRMEVGKAGATRSQIGQTFVLAGDLVVNVFENDDQHAVEMTSAGSRRGPCSFFLLPCWRLRDLGLGLRLGLSRLARRRWCDALGRRTRTGTQESNQDRYGRAHSRERLDNMKKTH